MWLEQLARTSADVTPYQFPYRGDELDFRPLLNSMIADRLRKRDPRESARAFQRGLAEGLCSALVDVCKAHNLRTAVLSGGVFQNELLLEDLKGLLENENLQIWTNNVVPANDGGISLGQAALAAFV